MLIQNGSSVRLFITLLAISQVLKKIRLCRPFQTGLLLMPAHHHWTRLPTTLMSDSCRVRCHHWRITFQNATLSGGAAAQTSWVSSTGGVAFNVTITFDP